MGCVCELHRPDAEAMKELTDFRKVVEGQNEFATEFSESFLESGEVSLTEVVPIQLPAPIRRIEIKQSLGAVISFEDFVIGQTFNLHPF